MGSFCDPRAGGGGAWAQTVAISPWLWDHRTLSLLRVAGGEWKGHRAPRVIPEALSPREFPKAFSPAEVPELQEVGNEDANQRAVLAQEMHYAFLLCLPREDWPGTGTRNGTAIASVFSWCPLNQVTLVLLHPHLVQGMKGNLEAGDVAWAPKELLN